MAWEKVREHVDEAQGVHVIVLRNETALPPAEHHLMIYVGHDACPTCGHVVPKGNTGEIDPRGLVDAELAALEQAHAAVKAYRAKHRVQGLKG